MGRELGAAEDAGEDDAGAGYLLGAGIGGRIGGGGEGCDVWVERGEGRDSTLASVWGYGLGSACYFVKLYPSVIEDCTATGQVG
jgi:hypothetical protein